MKDVNEQQNEFKPTSKASCKYRLPGWCKTSRGNLQRRVDSTCRAKVHSLMNTSSSFVPKKKGTREKLKRWACRHNNQEKQREKEQTTACTARICGQVRTRAFCFFSAPYPPTRSRVPASDRMPLKRSRQVLQESRVFEIGTLPAVEIVDFTHTLAADVHASHRSIRPWL